MLGQESLPPSELWRARLAPVQCLSITHRNSGTATHSPSPFRDQSSPEATTKRLGSSVLLHAEPLEIRHTAMSLSVAITVPVVSSFLLLRQE